jgi:hypothetical protein
MRRLLFDGASCNVDDKNRILFNVDSCATKLLQNHSHISSHRYGYWKHALEDYQSKKRSREEIVGELETIAITNTLTKTPQPMYIGHRRYRLGEYEISNSNMTEDERHRLDKILEIREQLDEDDTLNTLVAKLVLATEVKENGSIFVTVKLNFKNKEDSEMFMEDVNQLIGESCGIII